jgi:hypothetical protein
VSLVGFELRVKACFWTLRIFCDQPGKSCDDGRDRDHSQNKPYSKAPAEGLRQRTNLPVSLTCQGFSQFQLLVIDGIPAGAWNSTSGVLKRAAASVAI